MITHVLFTLEHFRHKIKSIKIQITRHSYVRENKNGRVSERARLSKATAPPLSPSMVVLVALYLQTLGQCRAYIPRLDIALYSSTTVFYCCSFQTTLLYYTHKRSLFVFKLSCFSLSGLASLF